jgi:ABC-type transport system substrate-binding protein
LLQVRLPGTSESLGAYRVAARTDQEVRFEPSPAGVEGAELKPVIVERLLPDPVQALDSLRKGKVDMLDRIVPVDAMRLQQDASLVVGRYAFPSLHVLVPNTANPFLANRTFRRALTYGINRDVILNKGLLENRPLEGCRILSAPLPAGLTENDPSSYAYNEGVLPLPYDPVMSIILMKLTEQQLFKAASERKEEAPELKELVLAHPVSELAKFACRMIQAQLDTVGVKCRLRELPPGQVQDPKREYDLLYLEFTMREPVVDAGRIFAPGGLLPIADSYVSLVLRHVDNAENWKAARDRLQELHMLLFEDLPVIPLWQMADHFVYHRGVQGVRQRPVFLYENVEQLRVVPPMPSD